MIPSRQSFAVMGSYFTGAMMGMTAPSTPFMQQHFWYFISLSTVLLVVWTLLAESGKGSKVRA